MDALTFLTSAATFVAVCILNLNLNKKLDELMATTQELEAEEAQVNQAIADAAARVIAKLNNLDNVPQADIDALVADVTALQNIASDSTKPVTQPS